MDQHTSEVVDRQMTHPARLRDIADLVTGRGLPVSAQQLREIASDLEHPKLLSDQPTEREIRDAFIEVGKRRLQSIHDYETLWKALTKLQIAQGKKYHYEPSDSEVAVGEPTVETARGQEAALER